MVNKRKIVKLIETNKWEDALVLFCKNEQLALTLLTNPNGTKRIEIHKDNALIESLNGIQAEGDFTEISKAMLCGFFK